jgi:mono/diheme cytochrome c family protein
MIRAACLALVVAIAGCGSARRSGPLGTAPRLTTEAQRHGQRLFMQYCNQCHPGGDAGLAPALNDKPLPGAAIKLQVREGFGKMPAFSDQEIDRHALDDIVSYVHALRHGG